MRALPFMTVMVICCAILCQGCVRMKDLYQQGIVKTRKPGQQMVDSAENTMKRRCCPPYEKNVIYVEDAGALPERVLPGEELNHRIRYAYCPTAPSQVVHARLVRKVVYHGKEVFRDVSTQKFCAGTWTVDAFIRVPRTAASGWYSIKVEIYSEGRIIKRSTSFFVKEKGKASGQVTSVVAPHATAN